MAKFARVAKILITSSARLSQLILRWLSWFNGVQRGVYYESFIKHHGLCPISILFYAVHHQHAMSTLIVAAPPAVLTVGGIWLA